MADDGPLGALPDPLLDAVVQLLDPLEAQRVRGACRRLKDAVERAEWSSLALAADARSDGVRRLRGTVELVRSGRVRLRPASQLHLVLTYGDPEDLSAAAANGALVNAAEALASTCAPLCASFSLETRAGSADLGRDMLAAHADSFLRALLAYGGSEPPLERLAIGCDASDLAPADLSRSRSDLFALLAAAPRLQFLTLPDWCPLSEPAATALAASSPALRSLDALFDGEAAFCELGPLARLEELRVRVSSEIELADRFAAFASSPAGRNLRSLYIGTGRGRRALRVAASPAALASLPRMAALQELHFLLEMDRRAAHTAEAVAEALAGARSLRRLSAVVALGAGRPLAPALGLAAALGRLPPARRLDLELDLYVEGLLAEDEGRALAALAAAAAPFLRRAELLVSARVGQEPAAAEAARAWLRRGGELGARLAAAVRPPERRGAWGGVWP